jgi:uncharacterized protein with HEPN domain
MTSNIISFAEAAARRKQRQEAERLAQVVRAIGIAGSAVVRSPPNIGDSYRTLDWNPAEEDGDEQKI